jgi:regulator of protease activity HflC (stomatin/prohibitin superfamily)
LTKAIPFIIIKGRRFKNRTKRGEKMMIGILIGAVLGTLAFAGLVWWLCRCLVVVGTEEQPAQAIKLRFGRAVAVLAPGFHFVFHPMEKLRIFPTTVYQLNYEVVSVHSKREPPYETAVMRVLVTVYFRWPRVGKEYQFEGQRVEGGKLLMETHYALPVNPAQPNGALREFFSRGVADAIRRVMVTRTHVQCREDKERMEREIKEYLLQEPGNPFKECCIPGENIDVAITELSFPEEMEKSFTEPEIAKRIRRGIYHRTRGFVEAGIDPNIAGFLVIGLQEGKPVDVSQLRDLAIFRHLWSQ